MLTVTQVNALGNIVNSSWGRSSNGTYDCKTLVEGHRLKVMYSTMAYFASEKAMSAQTQRLAQESNDRIAEMVKVMKDKFKESTGSSLALVTESDRDTLELVDASSLNPRRVCLFRRNIIFEISN